MTTRLKKIRAMLTQSAMSSILITDPIDVAYITGFSSSNVVLIIGHRSNRIFTDFRYHSAISRFCSVHKEWKYQKIETGMAEAITPYLLPGSKVGFQSNRCTVDQYKELKKLTRNVRFVSCSNRIADLLMVKQADEIRKMTKAAAITDQAFTQLLESDILRPGVSEQSVARKLEQYCMELGSDKPSFDTIVLFGANTALPHGKPSSKKLRRGDFVLIDFGCTIDEFVSDMTRTIVLGKATAKQRELYSIVRDAQQYACSEAHAGMIGKNIDALARVPIERAGFAKEFGHALGHGVGRRVHEAPRIGTRNTQPIPVNTVITIEPGIYMPGFGGVRIEDMAVVLEKGIRLLTHTPRALVEL